ncbi:hypothetical protein TrVE_jg8309 [Triparma verrucosa]|nr:hypothetical protein TrVE_jg8309 [Triparma verrucosa]
MSLRNSSYPFDWLRTSMLGLVEDFRTDFLSLWEDMEGVEPRKFCHGSMESKIARGVCTFEHVHRGRKHVFVHDDPRAEREKFQRRIDRLKGLDGEQMFFFRIAATTEEIHEVVKLQSALAYFYNTEPSSINLLLILDRQQESGLWALSDSPGIHVGTAKNTEYTTEGMFVWNTAMGHEIVPSYIDLISPWLMKFSVTSISSASPSP